MPDNTNGNNCTSVRDIIYNWHLLVPTIFGEELSYYEKISKLIWFYSQQIEALGDLEERVGKNTADIAKLVGDMGALQNKVIQDFQEFSQAQEQRFSELQHSIDSRFSELNETLTTTLNEYDIKIEAFDERITQSVAQMKLYTDNQVSKNNDYILEHVSEFLGQIKVINYFTGQYVAVQEMLDYLSQLHLQLAPTYDKLTAKNITYAELAASGLTYTEIMTKPDNIPSN